jgi:AraC-like DNA-binding protein
MPGTVADHDRVPDVPDPDATALADALTKVRLDGAIFLRAEYTGSWAYRSRPTSDMARMLAPGAERVILFHVVATNTCWVEVDGGERHWAEAGDVIVLPYGDQHRMGGIAEAPVVDIASFMSAPPWQTMPVLRHGTAGDTTDVVCGYLLSDDPLFDPRLRAFPRVFVVRPPEGPAREWVRASIEYATQQTSVVGEVLRSPTMVPQLLLVEVLKLHLSSAPAQTGLLKAARDPVVAPALAKVHEHPERKWTVAELAAEGNVSVSLLDERFRELLGMPPIRYLTGWRMHLARDLLGSSSLGVAAIARRVGYESEEAFSRAFKRLHGESPSQWRKGS